MVDEPLAQQVTSEDGTFKAVLELLGGGGNYSQKEVGEKVGTDARTVKERLEAWWESKKRPHKQPGAEGDPRADG